jgi:hypothetical protein
MINWPRGLFAFVVSVVAATSASALEVREARELPTFTAISAHGTMTMEVSVGESDGVQIIRDEAIPVEVVVRNGVLRVASPSTTRADRKVRIVIAVRRLDSVDFSGIWARLTIVNVQAENFHIALSESIDATLSGTCGVGRFLIAGSPQVDASQLACHDVDVDIAGSGHADVRASRQASVRILGSGNVDLYGSGELIASRGARRRITVHQD